LFEKAGVNRPALLTWGRQDQIPAGRADAAAVPQIRRDIAKAKLDSAAELPTMIKTSIADYGEKLMRRYLIAVALMAGLVMPASAQLSSQQQRMKDCNTQASAMSGDARKQFMSSCLSGSTAEPKKPHCVNGKPCGNSCIAKDKVCHK